MWKSLRRLKNDTSLHLVLKISGVIWTSIALLFTVYLVVSKVLSNKITVTVTPAITQTLLWAGGVLLLLVLCGMALKFLRRIPLWVFPIIILICSFGFFGLKISMRIYSKLSRWSGGSEYFTQGFFILLPLCALGFLWWVWRRTHPDTTPAIPGWMKSDTFYIVLMCSYLYFYHWWRFPEFWVEYMITPWFFTLALGIVLFASMLERNNKSPFKHKLAKFGLVVIGIHAIGHFVYNPVYDKLVNSGGDFKPSAFETKNTPPAKGCLLPTNEKVKKVVVEFWQKNLPGPEGEKGIAIAERESQFNQFKNGEVYRRCPTPDNPSTEDVGVMQINEPSWLAKSQEIGYDIHTLEGNLKFALWMYKFRTAEGKPGWYDWRGSGVRQVAKNKSVGKKSLTIIAPVGKWSEIVPNASYVRCEPPSRVKVAVNGNHDEPYDDGPGIKLIVKNIDTLEFMATKQEVSIPCTFN